MAKEYSLLVFFLSFFSFTLAITTARSLPENPPSAGWMPCNGPHEHYCKNGGICYQDGHVHFCKCPDGFGGLQCERMVDAVIFLDAQFSAEQLAALCKLAFVLAAFAFVTAFCGCLCCCTKHLNARRLYLANLRLIKENRLLREANQRQSKRTVRLYAALARAQGELAPENGAADKGNKEEQLSRVLTPLTTPFSCVEEKELLQMSGDEYAKAKTRPTSFDSCAMPNSPNDSSHSLMKRTMLTRQLSDIHDELQRSIEGINSVVEIVHENPTKETGEQKQQQQKWWTLDNLRSSLKKRMNLGILDEDERDQEKHLLNLNNEDKSNTERS